MIVFKKLRKEEIAFISYLEGGRKINVILLKVVEDGWKDQKNIYRMIQNLCDKLWGLIELNNLCLLMRGFKANAGALLWFYFYSAGWKNYRRCSKCVPCTWLHFLHRRAIACRTLANVLGLCLIWSNAVNIRSISSCLVLTGLTYTTLFTCLQRIKSRGVRSGDLGGHATGPPLPIHFSL